MDMAAAISGTLVVCVMMYFILCSVNIRYFNCFSTNGRLTWSLEPNQVCFDFANMSLHAKLFPVVLIGLIVFVCGIPGFFGYTLIKNRHTIQDRETLIRRLRNPCVETLVTDEDATIAGSSGNVTRSSSQGSRRSLESSTVELETIQMAAACFLLMKKIGVAVKRYHKHSFFYELLIMLRKACIVLTVLFHNPIEQVKLGI